MERAVRVPCRGLAAAHFRPERNSFSDTRLLPAKSFKPHAPYSLSGAPFSGHIMTAIDRKPRSRSHPACGRFSRVSSTDLWPADLNRFICRSRRRVGWCEFSARLFKPLCLRCSTEGITSLFGVPELDKHGGVKGVVG